MRFKLLLPILLLSGCFLPVWPEPPAGADDDDATDDDDAVDDDDVGADDDDTGGDFEADGLTFEFTASVSTGAGDDDDSASYTVATEFQITYFVDINNGITNCVQHVTVEGEAWFEFGIVNTLDDQGTCDNCTGFIEYDPATITDISNPDLDPEHCDPAELVAVGVDYATRMLSPADPNATPPNMGDFLTLATWDYTTHDILGTDLTVSTEVDRTAAGTATFWEEYTLTYSHAGFVWAHPQSLAGSAGLDSVNRAPHAGSDYLAAWEIFLNSADNTHDPLTNQDMKGNYGGIANYTLFLGG
jgi:hypothetical protein